MIERDDLRAATSAGIMTEAQAASLAALADSRRGAREGLQPGDEPFELFKGFNEIFIVVGLVTLAVGWSAVVGLEFFGQISNPQQSAATYGGLGAIIFWGLSEYFIRRRRMVAPAIALSLIFAGNAAVSLSLYFAQPFMIAQEDYASLPLPFAIGTATLLIFWMRFRVPFALAMIAVGLFTVAMLLAANTSGTPQSVSDMFLLSADGPFAWITLALGIAVFAVAMVFDISDRHRVTRRSANGFWLHVVAAPALVNTLALSLLERDSTVGNLMLLSVIAVFTLIAIIIDRRSFLMAAIGYVVAIATTVFGGTGAALTMFWLGVALLFLGAFWERIRAQLLVFLPSAVLDRLPPSSVSRD